MNEEQKPKENLVETSMTILGVFSKIKMAINMKDSKITRHIYGNRSEFAYYTIVGGWWGTSIYEWINTLVCV